MPSISEFHFAFYGIATVAATLGYACARRAALSLTSSNESSANVEAGPPEERSLKRKLDSEEHDAEAGDLPRPMKRNRTPPIDQHETDEDFDQEWEVIVAPPPYDEVAGLRQPEEPVQDKATPPHEDSHAVEQNVTPVREPTPPAYPEFLSRPEKGAEVGRCTTPQPFQADLSPNELDIPSTCATIPPVPTVSAKTEPAIAFSAFSNSSSPFASYSNVSGASPFTLSGQTVRTTPAWKRDNEIASDVLGRTSPLNALAPSPNDAVISTFPKPSAHFQSKNVLQAPNESLAKPSSCLTGEEGENVEAELKGVKLFIKRGRKEFTDGIYGHIKILTQKVRPPSTEDENSPRPETETNPRTRLLFRRDPLGQVSMNAGLRPTVRCHFDTAETILRVILMEPVVNGKDSKEEVVIYALKPGRAQKADFQSFAKALCDHEGLRSRVVTNPTIPASGVAAAS